MFSAFKNIRVYDLSDFLGTMGLLVGNVFVALLIQGSVLFLYFNLYEFRLFNFANQIPIFFLWITTFIAIDFVFYWYHRLSHRVRILWAIHMNHHSSTEMNFSVSFRQAWFGPISKVPFFRKSSALWVRSSCYGSCGSDFNILGCDRTYPDHW